MRQNGVPRRRRVPWMRPTELRDCGAAAFASVAWAAGHEVSVEEARDLVRTDNNGTHLVHELDATVAHRVHALMRRMGLCFGSLDFIVTPEGEHVFLEVNPVGQFGWIAEQTGLPIYERLADLLIDEA